MTAPGCLVAPMISGGSSLGAVDFDGTSTYLSRGAALTGLSDGKAFSSATWFRLDATPSGNTILQNTPARFSLGFTGDNLQFIGSNSAGTNIVTMTGVTNFTSGAAWYCLLLSVNLAATLGHMYLGDADEISTESYTDANIDFTGTDWGFAAGPAGTGKFDGGFAETWFTNTFIDFSVESNRRKFISSTGQRVPLGEDGSIPTGTAPLIYFRVKDSEAADAYAVNRGSGGGFTVTGTLTKASSAP